nr:gag pol polyprotein [Hymenolepis microstoma]
MDDAKKCQPDCRYLEVGIATPERNLPVSTDGALFFQRDPLAPQNTTAKSVITKLMETVPRDAGLVVHILKPKRPALDENFTPGKKRFLQPTGLVLQVANNTKIDTYDQKFLNLVLGLRRESPFIFLIANVLKPTIGPDLLSKFRLLDDATCLRVMSSDPLATPSRTSYLSFHNFFVSRPKYGNLIIKQKSNPEITEIISNPSLRFKYVPLQDPDIQIHCNVSTGKPKPFVPQAHHRKIFDHFHGFSHPSIRSRTKWFSDRFKRKTFEKASVYGPEIVPLVKPAESTNILEVHSSASLSTRSAFDMFMLIF